MFGATGPISLGWLSVGRICVQAGCWLWQVLNDTTFVLAGFRRIWKKYAFLTRFKPMLSCLLRSKRQNVWNFCLCKSFSVAVVVACHIGHTRIGMLRMSSTFDWGVQLFQFSCLQGFRWPAILLCQWPSSWPSQDQQITQWALRVLQFSAKTNGSS